MTGAVAPIVTVHVENNLELTRGNSNFFSLSSKSLMQIFVNDYHFGVNLQRPVGRSICKGATEISNQ